VKIDFLVIKQENNTQEGLLNLQTKRELNNISKTKFAIRRKDNFDQPIILAGYEI